MRYIYILSNTKLPKIRMSFVTNLKEAKKLANQRIGVKTYITLIERPKRRKKDD